MSRSREEKLLAGFRRSMRRRVVPSSAATLTRPIISARSPRWVSMAGFRSASTRVQQSWMQFGGGLKLTREVFRRFNVVSFPVGNVGVQMGGWFRKEINSVDDLKGLKFRIGGFGGAVVSKLGAVPQQVAAGDIYSALEKGTLDAVEFIGPYDDEKLGFVRVAKYYYTPGWWEGSAQITALVNIAAWESFRRPSRGI